MILVRGSAGSLASSRVVRFPSRLSTPCVRFLASGPTRPPRLFPGLEDQYSYPGDLLPRPVLLTTPPSRQPAR